MTAETENALDDFESVIESMIKAQIAILHTGMPARIVTYDPATGKARVQPVIRGRRDGSATFKLPVISNVPVCWPAGGGCSLTFHLQEGDRVWLCFGERSLDEYLQSVRVDITAKSRRRYALTDAIAIPGVQPFVDPLENGDGVGIVLGEDPRSKPLLPLRLEISPDVGIGLGDGTNDLLKILSDALVALSTTVVATSLGPQPLSSAATLTSLATALALIKKY